MSARTFLSKFNYKVKSTVIFAVFFAVAFTIFICASERTADCMTTFILCAAGCVLGWLVGILTTPYGTEDKNNLNNFSKLAGTFISGYLLAKLDKILEQLMEPTQFIGTLTGIRFVLVIVFFIMTYIVVFVFRIYTRADEPTPVAD